jgi:hypothetical protein
LWNIDVHDDVADLKTTAGFQNTEHLAHHGLFVRREGKTGSSTGQAGYQLE